MGYASRSSNEVVEGRFVAAFCPAGQTPPESWGWWTIRATKADAEIVVQDVNNRDKFHRRRRGTICWDIDPPTDLTSRVVGVDRWFIVPESELQQENELGEVSL